MPVYEYECEACGAEFEASQRITEPPLETHEDCGGPVRRLISRTSFTLKGGGWYSDHYGLKKDKNGAAEKKDATKPAEKKAEKAAPTPSSSSSSSTGSTGSD